MKEEKSFSFLEKLVPLPHLRGARFRPAAYLSSEEARNQLKKSGIDFPGKAHRISCLMCKGGVGKTTTAYFLALRLASYGARVLVIDSDPQGNLTEAMRPQFYGYQLNESTPVLVDVLTGRCTIQEAALRLTPNFYLIPSTSINSLLETKLSETKRHFPFQLDWELQKVENDFDFIIMDCAPSINLVNALAVYASDLVLLPIQLDGFSTSGLKLTMSEIQDLENKYNFRTETRILVNKFNSREKLSFLFLGHLAGEYRSAMMKTTIRRSAQIRTFLALKKDLFGLNKSHPKEDFDNLACEILLRAEKLKKFNA